MNVVRAGTSARMTGTYWTYPDVLCWPPKKYGTLSICDLYWRAYLPMIKDKFQIMSEQQLALKLFDQVCPKQKFFHPQAFVTCFLIWLKTLEGLARKASLSKTLSSCSSSVITLPPDLLANLRNLWRKWRSLFIILILLFGQFLKCWLIENLGFYCITKGREE